MIVIFKVNTILCTSGASQPPEGWEASPHFKFFCGASFVVCGGLFKSVNYLFVGVNCFFAGGLPRYCAVKTVMRNIYIFTMLAEAVDNGP